MNIILKNAKSDTPSVGMGCTEVLHSDRHACTVIEVLSPKRVRVQRDTAVRTDSNGMSDCQSWEFTPNPKGRTQVVSLRKNGRWCPVGETSDSTPYIMGYRSEYYDYSF